MKSVSLYQQQSVRKLNGEIISFTILTNILNNNKSNKRYAMLVIKMRKTPSTIDIKVDLNEEACHVPGYLGSRVEVSVFYKLIFQFNSIPIRSIEGYLFYLTK